MEEYFRFKYYQEILKYIDQFVYVDQTYNDIKLSKIDTKLILDYITNLQQENEKLNRMCELYSKSLYNAELTDYKSRCKKAIEYIDNVEISYCRKGFLEDGILISKHVIKNILNGSGKHETK